jgi:N-acyl-D-aspartate/D-glutamate deacylase
MQSDAPGRLRIRGGTVVDGSGGAPFVADVWIDEDRIVAIERAAARSGRGRAALEIDATGKVVAPGFIDVHAHDDLAVIRTPLMPFKVSQGITTVVVGNCGIGVAPTNDALVRELRGGPGHRSAALGSVEDIQWTSFGDYLDCVDQARPATNVAALVGHNTIRATVCGEEERPVSAIELERMIEQVSAAMDAGALGLSSGLIYAPGRAADLEELGAMAAAAGSQGGLYVTHLRSEADELTAAIVEALAIGERGDCRVHISHLKAAGRGNWGTMEAVVARLAGLPQVTVDVYPYTAASTFLREALGAAGRRTPVLPSEVLIASAPEYSESEGKTLEALAESWGITGPEAAEKLSSLCPAGVTVVYFVMSEPDVEAVLGFDRAMIGTDGIPNGSRPHPRLYGTFPRVFGRYVRDRAVSTLTDTVRRATSLPAATFGLTDRGSIAVGKFADLVVFDPTTIADNATYTEPAQFASGIAQVIVNGQLAWQDGGSTGARAGVAIRRQPVPRAVST